MVEIYPGIESIKGKLGGKPCIKDTRSPVVQILEWLEAGETVEQIIDAFDGITRKDIEHALAFAKAIIEGEIRYQVPA